MIKTMIYQGKQQEIDVYRANYPSAVDYTYHQLVENREVLKFNWSFNFYKFSPSSMRVKMTWYHYVMSL